MTMLSKFAGTCRTCRQPFRAGTMIDWSRATGAVHADKALCQAVAVRPVPVAVVEAHAVTEFLKAAQGRGLRAPKVRFLAPGGGELRLGLAGGRTKYPGSVQVKVNGEWVGRVEADGSLTPRLAAMPGMVDTLTAVAQDPATAAARYGALMGRCSFCGLQLTDAGSVEVGYGPVCAKSYGLPHKPKGTPVLREEVAA